MVVVKKINNNVAVCRDGNQRELIAFGKGIGFPPMPYELTDLDRIDRTFYNVSRQYLPLLSDIPAEVVEFTARMMDDVQGRLPYETSSNIVLTLADHIAFSIERAKKGVYIRMPSIYEMEQSYPLEVRIGRRFVSAIEREFHLKLPKGEVQSIAMHFINARGSTLDTAAPQDDIQQQYDEVLEQTTQIIEWELDCKVQRDTFNYARLLPMCSTCCSGCSSSSTSTQTICRCTAPSGRSTRRWPPVWTRSTTTTAATGQPP